MLRKFLSVHLLALSLFVASLTQIHAAQEPSLAQPEIPFTVIIEQTDAPSPQTLDNIPVKITITNNSEQALTIEPPYIANVSFLNGDHTKSPIAVLIYDISETAMCYAIAAGGVLVGGAALCWVAEQLIRGMAPSTITNLTFDGPTLEQIAEMALFFGTVIGTTSGIYTLLHVVTTESSYHVKPHETLTIAGCINMTDMAQLQSGSLKPSIVSSTNISEFKDDQP